MKLAFTGHRPESLPFGENELSAACFRLKAMLLTEIMDRAKSGYDTFYCGAARGVDLIYARQVLLVRTTEYPKIKLVCVVPFEGQANGWNEKWRERYFTTLDQADDVVMTSKEYTRDCYHLRNRYMVDNSDALIALYNGSDVGGTSYTVKYARQLGKEIVIFDSNTLERTVIMPDRPVS